MAWGFTLDPFGTVKEVIEAWDPSRCTTERKCEQSLANALEQALINQKIERQYGSGKQKIDILVDDKVPIEIKYDLVRLAALQRLIGQLELYLKKWDNVILVLCGKISSNLLKDLRRFSDDKITFLSEEPIQIIIKGKEKSNISRGD